MSRTPRLPLALAVLVSLSAHACIKAPPIAVVDNRTALEIQAAGEYPVLEFESTSAVLEPGPTPASAKDIVSKAGLAAAGHDLDVFAVSGSQAIFIDSMLVLGCLGEADNGLLEYTPDRCDDDVEVSELLRAASRNNLHRRQVWQYLASKREDASIDAARRAWRAVHLEQVRCGTWVEQDGTWTQKTC